MKRWMCAYCKTINTEPDVMCRKCGEYIDFVFVMDNRVPEVPHIYEKPAILAEISISESEKQRSKDK